MPRQRIIVTGAAGFIGSHLTDQLLALGHDVVGVDNFDPFYPEARKRAHLRNALSHPQFRLVTADITDSPAILDLVQSVAPHGIIHLAAKAGVRPSIDDPQAYVRTNVLGTTVMLDAALTVKPLPKFVYASSSSVYGNRDDAPFRETDPVVAPVSPYAATKRACELLAQTFHHLHGLPVTGLRFFTAYGPRNRPDLAIAKFASLLETDQPIPMFGAGDTQRDYTYVLDIVDGVIKAYNHCRTCHLYNLGNSQPITLRDMIALMGQALGRTPKIITLPEQPGDVKQTYADIQLARQDIAYLPQTPFPTGLAHYVDWLRAEKEFVAVTP